MADHILEDFLRERRGEVKRAMTLDYTFERRLQLAREENQEIIEELTEKNQQLIAEKNQIAEKNVQIIEEKTRIAEEKEQLAEKNDRLVAELNELKRLKEILAGAGSISETLL